jgi:hypothetical protein
MFGVVTTQSQRSGKTEMGSGGIFLIFDIQIVEDNYCDILIVGKKII